MTKHNHNSDHNAAMGSIQQDFVSRPSEILTVLIGSKEKRTAVGINSKHLGPGTYITAVDDILLNEEVVIILKPYDASGNMLPATHLRLSEIISVLPFNSTFENPYFKATQFSVSQSA